MRMQKVACALIALTVASTDVFSQARRTKPTPKLPVIRATVTVKGDGAYAAPKARKEADEGIWNIMSIPEHEVKIDLPSPPDEFYGEAMQIGGENVWEYSANTEHAVYRLIVRDFPAMLDNKGIADTLNTSFEKAYGGRKAGSSLLSKRSLSYAGVHGLEFVTQEKDMIQKARFYILNKKLFALYITVRPKKYWPTMVKWADRYLDSFSLEVRPRNES